MRTNREKTSSVLGIAVSMLLHGIFFAGCLALDASNMSSDPTVADEPTEVNQVAENADGTKVKS